MDFLGGDALHGRLFVCALLSQFGVLPALRIELLAQSVALLLVVVGSDRKVEDLVLLTKSFLVECILSFYTVLNFIIRMLSLAIEMISVVLFEFVVLGSIFANITFLFN